MHSFNINRRAFLKSATASMAITAIGADAMDILHPAKPRRVGLIGSGWYGKSDLFRLMQVSTVQVVALCDPDKNILREAGDLVATRGKMSKPPALYGDYRKMLAENQFDLVLIGTPDHWHALTAIEAMKAGAHVYIQKPISVDVIEGEAMLAAARQYNRVAQIGTQRRSTPHLLDAKSKVIDAGLLGKVAHVEMCCYFPMRNNANPPVQPVPDFFDYEMWTGPAPMRPYDGLPHVRWWRAFMEYGNGIVGDMCVHMFDTARWLLKLGWPTRITSEGGIYMDKQAKSNISDTQTAVFEFPELNCVWQHRSWGTAPDPDYPWGLFIYGERGTLKISTMKYDFIPSSKDEKPIHQDVVFEKEQYPEDLKEKAIELNAAPATRRHMLNFLQSIEEKKRPTADIEDGHISTASCILANMSMKLGRPLSYNPVTKEITGDPEATAQLKRAYRQPWTHP